VGDAVVQDGTGASGDRSGLACPGTFVTLAQVDGARRDLLETISHGPRGDIVSVYTTVPWLALCAEVEKLRISLREDIVADKDFRTLAATHRMGRNRWRKLVTPPGPRQGCTWR
jgi:hypothetical protein